MRLYYGYDFMMLLIRDSPIKFTDDFNIDDIMLEEDVFLSNLVMFVLVIYNFLNFEVSESRTSFFSILFWLLFDFRIDHFPVNLIVYLAFIV